MHPKDAEGIANSVDPEQPDLGLHSLPRTVCPKTKEHYGNKQWETGDYSKLHLPVLIYILADIQWHTTA